MYFFFLEYFREREFIFLVDFDYDCNLFEFEQNFVLLVFKGRFRFCLSYWYIIGVNSFVIDIIKFGYCILFISIFCQVCFFNNQLVFNNVFFVELVIVELVYIYVVVELFFILYVVNLFFVLIQFLGKKRFILDLCYVNYFVWKQKFRCEDWRVLLLYVNKGDYFFSFDFKFGYYYIDIFLDY